MNSPYDLDIKIFADGADLPSIQALAADPRIRGFTTNPTLMRKAGVTDYVAFARDLLAIVGDRPVSFEVFADDFANMEAQALEIASWGQNVNVKIPVTNTSGEFTGPLVARLSRQGVIVNVTAVMTVEQVRRIARCLAPETPAIVSVFAGRIADTGRDPLPVMRQALTALKTRPKAELLWASPRELFNLFQADAAGCHIITVTPDILKKLAGTGKELGQLSLETVQMFRTDAIAAGYSISIPVRRPQRRWATPRAQGAV